MCVCVCVSDFVCVCLRRVSDILCMSLVQLKRVSDFPYYYVYGSRGFSRRGCLTLHTMCMIGSACMFVQLEKGVPEDYIKGEDIMDIWFDSGVSWASVLRGEWRGEG